MDGSSLLTYVVKLTFATHMTPISLHVLVKLDNLVDERLHSQIRNIMYVKVI